MTAPHIIDALAELDQHTQFDPGPHVPQAEPEVPARRQPGTVVQLFVEGEEPYTVLITNRERLAYEKTAARHKEWPAMEVGRNFAMTFVCWSAARRAGHTALTFEQFCDVLLDYDEVKDAPADPTR